MRPEDKPKPITHIMNRIVFSLGLLTTLSLGSAAFAQREAPDPAARRQQRQAMLQNMTPDQRVQWFQNQWQQRYDAATPEQKARMDARRAEMESAMKAQGLDPSNPQSWAQFMQNGGNQKGRGGASAADREAQMRALMNASGLTDKAMQDPIVAFVFQRERERQPLLALARDVAASLRTSPATGAATMPVAGGDAAATTAATHASDEAIAQKLAAYQQALDKDKLLAADELAALDKQVSFSTNPRLKAFMSLVGLLNPDSLALGGAATIFAPERAQNPTRPASTSTATQG